MSSKNPSDHKPSVETKKTPNINTDHIVEFAKTHSRETISYVLMILGLVLLFFNSLYGGLLVGIVSGIYFGDKIVNYIANWKLSIDSQQMSHNLVLAGLAVAFLISAPAIFLGMAVSIGIKQLFVTKG